MAPCRSEWIHIRIDQYEAEISVSSLPEWPIPKFRKLLKLIYDPWNIHTEERLRMEEHLKAGLKEAEFSLALAKHSYAKLYIPVSRNDRSESADWCRERNRALKAGLKRAEGLVKHWKSMKTIYDKERTKHK